MAPDLGRILKEAQKLEKRLEEARKALETMTVEGTAGGGAVRVVMNGHKDVRSVSIEPSVLEGGDAAMLEDLLLSAFRDAKQRCDDLIAREMGKLGTAGLPGL
ncbi:MAG: YbaB/EbfC family nucleoid-associated protein [Candidatus Eisenbacteria bacterium]|nr:YbaB/EbfC family nucleoid-associated protein [Candidatus Eisenbacteria bacterium]